MSIINKNICLNLNSNLQPIGYRTVKDVIIDLAGAAGYEKPACLALDIDYALDENGLPMYNKPTYMNAVDWDTWIELQVRSYDHVINTQHKQIRVPTITIAANYSKMPIKKFSDRPSRHDIYYRDGGICQYTGKKINKLKSTIDHVIPKSRGGQDSWTNLVLCSKDVNLKKSNKLLKECDLKLLNPPTKPKSVPMYYLIEELNHPSWALFLKK